MSDRGYLEALKITFLFSLELIKFAIKLFPGSICSCLYSTAMLYRGYGLIDVLSKMISAPRSLLGFIGNSK